MHEGRFTIIGGKNVRIEQFDTGRKTPMPPPRRNPKVPAAWQPRFGIRGMLLTMIVVSVMGTGGYYLMMSFQGGRAFQLAFILFTIAAPLLVMVAVSIIRALLDRKPPRK